MEFEFREAGGRRLARFRVDRDAGAVWLAVPVLTEMGASRQRKSLRPADAVRLGQALVAEGLDALLSEDAAG